MSNKIYNFQESRYLLRIKVCSTNPKIMEFYKNFKLNHNGDSGIDLYNDSITINTFQVGTIDFGIKCEMIDLYSDQYVSYYLVPRSSIANTNFQLANSIGIIDAGYRGPLKAKIRCFHNVNDTLNEGSYFQIVSPDLKPIVIEIVENLSDTTRGSGGFGSTGNN
jgi:dUTP pyrophosphatase